MQEKEYYLHTINGEPAYFTGWQIVFAMGGGYHRTAQRLCKDLKQIHKERDISRRNRAKKGYPDQGWAYGYIRVRLPA